MRLAHIPEDAYLPRNKDTYSVLALIRHDRDARFSLLFRLSDLFAVLLCSLFFESSGMLPLFFWTKVDMNLFSVDVGVDEIFSLLRSLSDLVRRTFEDDPFGENSLGTSVSPAEWTRSLVRACSY
jgi:hypothetical protein